MDENKTNTQTPTNDEEVVEETSVEESTEESTQEESTDTAEETTSGSNDALQLIDIETTIKSFHASITSKRQEISRIREMMKDTLENDQTYAEHTEAVNDAKRIQKETQEQLYSVPSIISAKEDMKELRADMKEIQEALSTNLMKYYELADTNVITMDDGEAYVIQTQAKLVKQSSKYKP